MPGHLRVRQAGGILGGLGSMTAMAPGMIEDDTTADAFARKRGFTVPVGDWILGEGARLGQLVARQPGVAAIADPVAVERLFARGGRREGFAAWTLLFFALWHRRHVMGEAVAGGVFDALGG